MATTKVSGELVDLNEATSESGLKIPSGTQFNRPTAAAGQIRNNTNETSDGSASCEEYYNGTAWQKINNVALPVYYRAVLYTGTGSTQSITGLGFKPDLLWIKERDGTDAHFIQDSSRGSTYTLYTNANSGQFNETQAVTSFDADGFTLGSYQGTNNNGNLFVAYGWQANGGNTSSNSDGSATSTVQVNTAAGFSIAQMTWASAGSIGHGLGSTPEFILLKSTNASEDWQVYHTAMGTGNYMKLNDTAGITARADSFSTVNSTIVTNSWTGASVDWIMYSFVSVAGFSKFGSYTGNATAGQAITTGFSPTWILIKSTVGNANWRLYDTTRGITAGGFFRVQATNAEDTANAPNLDITATGFEINANGVFQGLNASGNLYIYAAFK